MEYLNGYSIAIKHVIRKVGLYNWKVISPQGCNFQIGGLVYDIRIYYKLFEWSVMLFSLTNASTALQQFINDIFSNILDVCIMIYLDNILIYSNNISEHYQHVWEVLRYLHKTNLYAKAEKYKFHSKSVEYIGYILSPSGLTMSNDKVKIIQDWPKLKKVNDIQSFLGFANFYYWFIFNYSDIVIPLTQLI